MNPEIIKLPNFVIAELYKDCIVDFENTEEVEELVTTEQKELPEENNTPQKAPLRYLGENKKNVVVLVEEAKSLIINEDELEFLTKILTACNLNIADIAIINGHNHAVDYADLKEQFAPQFLLLLGIDPSSIKLPFTIPHFQVQPYGGNTIVCTPPLSTMLTGDEESISLKRKLWVSLKAAFKL